VISKGLTPGQLAHHYAERAGMADQTTGGPVNRPRAADDFETIRARIEELRRERAAEALDRDNRSGRPRSGRSESDADRRRRERMEGSPPPWVPTIFVKTA
jgi:hypothetical protein